MNQDCEIKEKKERNFSKKDTLYNNNKNNNNVNENKMKHFSFTYCVAAHVLTVYKFFSCPFI